VTIPWLHKGPFDIVRRQINCCFIAIDVDQKMCYKMRDGPTRGRRPVLRLFVELQTRAMPAAPLPCAIMNMIYFTVQLPALMASR